MRYLFGCLIVGFAIYIVAQTARPTKELVLSQQDITECNRWAKLGNPTWWTKDTSFELYLQKDVDCLQRRSEDNGIR